ncbi:MAG: putative GTPase ObgE [Microgenomates group bacterium LiPW_31]|nr:MAG: putative GTPase ObgE [Microgenomates group bacterium LiPW_31]
MLVDEVDIVIKAGDGGRGRVAFLHSKFVSRGGPSGGDGGHGGDVYIEGVSDIGALYRFRYKIRPDWRTKKPAKAVRI